MHIGRIWQQLLMFFQQKDDASPLDRARIALAQGYPEEALAASNDVLYHTLVILGQATGQILPTHGSQEERAHQLNQALTTIGVYAQQQGKLIDSWIAIAEQARYHDIADIALGTITAMIQGIERFARIADLSLDVYVTNATPAPAHQHLTAASIATPPQALPQHTATKGAAYFSDNAPIVAGSMAHVSGFVGRHEEVLRLRHLLHQHRHLAVVPHLDGAAGYGLTAIAAEVLWRIEQDQPSPFPGGLLTLNGYHRGGNEALHWIFSNMAAAWQRPAIAQATTIALQGEALRAALSGAPALLVIDQADSGLPLQTLIDFLAPAGITIFITSRHLVHADQISVFRLSPLAVPAALTLFQTRYLESGGHEHRWDEDAARYITGTLGNIPLSIELTAQLAAFAEYELPFMASRLDQAFRRGHLAPNDDPNALLRYLVDLCLHTLDASSQHRFPALAILAGSSWSKNAALAVLASSDHSQTTPAAMTFQTFVRCGFIQCLSADGVAPRYRLHPYVRDIAGRLLLDQPSVMAAAGHAMASHFAGVAITRRPPEEDTRVLLEDEAHLEAGLQLAHQQGEHEVVITYCIGLYRLWQRQGLWQESTRWLAWGIIAAQTVGDRPREAQLHDALGTTLRALQRRRAAGAAYANALAIWRTLDNHRQMASVRFALGQLAEDEQDRDGAWHQYDRSRHDALVADDEQGQARALQALGLIAEAQGRIDEARAAYEHVFALRQAAGDAVGQAGALNVLGVLEFHQGNLAAATDLLLASLRLATDAHNLYWEAEAEYWFGEIANQQHTPTVAQQHWLLALMLYQRQGRQRDSNTTLQRLHQLG